MKLNKYFVNKWIQNREKGSGEEVVKIKIEFFLLNNF